MSKKVVSWSLISMLFLVFCASVFLAGRFTERSLASERYKTPHITASYRNGIITLTSSRKISIQFERGMRPGNETDFLTKLENEAGYSSKDVFEARQNLDRKRIKVVKVPPTRLVVLEGLKPRFR
jgi:hypothetical protein